MNQGRISSIKYRDVEITWCQKIQNRLGNKLWISTNDDGSINLVSVRNPDYTCTVVWDDADKPETTDKMRRYNLIDSSFNEIKNLLQTNEKSVEIRESRQKINIMFNDSTYPVYIHYLMGKDYDAATDATLTISAIDETSTGFRVLDIKSKNTKGEWCNEDWIYSSVRSSIHAYRMSIDQREPEYNETNIILENETTRLIVKPPANPEGSALFKEMGISQIEEIDPNHIPEIIDEEIFSDDEDEFWKRGN
jgi:hypothetical protein